MEIFRALAVIAEPPSKEAAVLADILELGPVPSAADYTELFVFQLSPYASVYLGPEGMMGGEARDRIAGFWRALGQAPPREADHLSIMLGFYASLIDQEDAETDAVRKASWNRARNVFLWEHLLSWLPVYLMSVSDFGFGFYTRWAKILSNAILDEASNASSAGNSLSIHLRNAPGVMDPRTSSLNEFLASLLAPVRSGMILTKADLARGARQLKLLCRIGERKYILETLLSQDIHQTLDWLSQECTAWATRHQLCTAETQPIASYWAGRAQTAATLLNDLKESADFSPIT